MQSNSYRKGFTDGIPIGLGYLSVSFTFGMAAVSGGIPVWVAVFISMTNLTSAGQFAGLSLMLSGGSYIEMALTQLVINLRYALMSVSLSQKLDTSVRLLDRFLIAFGNTDEIFAVASGQPHDVGRRYLYGLMTAPYFGWALGTFIGAAASSLLPAGVQSALGIAIYGMFLAIIVPPAKRNRTVLLVVAIAVALSTALSFTPLSGGFTIIICAVVAAAIGAVVHPVGGETEAAA